MSSNTATLDAPLEEEALPRKKWSGKRITLIAVVILLLAGGGFAGWKIMAAKKAKEAEHTKKDHQAEQINVFVDTPDILVNVSTGQGRTKFLKLAVTLQVKGEVSAAEIKKNMPKIIDSFQVYLRELRAEDLNGSAGMFLLKEELLRQVNVEVSPHRVDNVLIKEILLQ